MKRWRCTRFAWLASAYAFAFAFAVGCGIDNSLVGGRCLDGFVASGSECASPEEPGLPRTFSDEEAGADGSRTWPFIPWDPHGDSGAEVGSTEDASMLDADRDANDGGGAEDADAGDPGGTDAASDASGVSDAIAAADATAGDADAIDGSASTSDAAASDGSVADAAPPTCDLPLVACHGVCIAVTSDRLNCGACGKICASNLCTAGECQGATPGDIVLLGHDYTNATLGSAPVKVLANTFAIPTTDPIRVLSFESGLSPATVAQTKYLAAASITGRAVAFTVASSAADLTSGSLGRDYDIVVLHDASVADPVATGASWAASLGTFASKGGVVLAIDRGTSNMPALLSNAGLLTVGSHALLAEGSHLLVTAAGDVVGAQVLSPYAAFGSPVSFQGVAAPGADLSWVVRAAGNDGLAADPVVVHRIVR